MSEKKQEKKTLDEIFADALYDAPEVTGYSIKELSSMSEKYHPVEQRGIIKHTHSFSPTLLRLVAKKRKEKGLK